MVLAQYAELPRTHDVSLLGVELAGKDLHERRLPGAVWTREAIALSRRKGGGDVVEQYFGAVAHAYIANRNHSFCFALLGKTYAGRALDRGHKQLRLYQGYHEEKG